MNQEHNPLIITDLNGKKTVLLSLEDFNSYQETLHLMASPKNAQRLNEAIAEVSAGKVVPHELIEPWYKIILLLLCSVVIIINLYQQQ